MHLVAADTEGVGAASTQSTGGPVQRYKVMTHGESEDGAVVGDDLAGNHRPSCTTVRQNIENTLGQPLTPAQSAALRDNTNVVIVDQDSHVAGRTYFGANTASQIYGDAPDLKQAALDDQATHFYNALGLGYSTTDFQN